MSYISGISHSIASEMAGSSHTLPCSLSMLRSRVEAGKKQPRRSLEYGYSKERCSFTPPLALPLPPYDGSEMVLSGFLDEPSGKAEREEGLKMA